MKLAPTRGPAPRVTGVKDAMVIRQTARGPVVQKWPRKRGKATSGWQYYQQSEFAFAGTYSLQANVYDRIHAEAWIVGTTEVWRDVLTAAALGMLWVFEMPDGTTMQGWRVDNPNGVWMLDHLSKSPGSILWRDDARWATLHRPDRASILFTPDGAAIAWTSKQPDGVAKVFSAGMTSLTTSSTNHATKGTVLNIAADCQIRLFAMAIVPSSTSETYRPFIALLSGGAVSQILWKGDEWTPGATGQQMVPFAVPDVDLANGDKAFLGVTRTDGTGTSPLIARSTCDWWGVLPILSEGVTGHFGYADTNDLAVSDTVPSASGSYQVALTAVIL